MNMKNLYITIVALILIINLVQSQTIQNGIFSEPYNGKIPTVQQKDGTQYSFMYVREWEKFPNANSTSHSGFLWPDSNIILPDGSQNKIFSIAQSLDPESDLFVSINPKNHIDSKSSLYYDLTYIGFYCKYYRVPTLHNAVDTLILQVKFDKTPIMTLTEPNEPWIGSIYGANTLDYVMFNHDELSLLSSQPEYYTIKFPLDSSAINDTLPNGLNYFKLPVNIILKNNPWGPNPLGHASASISYKPGFSYNSNDTITNLNRIKFISNQVNGTSGISGTYPDLVTDDYNMSYIIHKDVFYQTGNYNEFLTNSHVDTLFTPIYLFKADFPFEQHWIEFLFTRHVIIGIGEDKELEDFMVYPNPSKDKISFRLPENNSSQLTIQVLDISGKVFINENVNTYDELSIKGLSKGLYQVLIHTQSGKVYRSKLIIE